MVIRRQCITAKSLLIGLTNLDTIRNGSHGDGIPSLSGILNRIFPHGIRIAESIVVPFRIPRRNKNDPGPV
jgi:hypothetical protein